MTDDHKKEIEIRLSGGIYTVEVELEYERIEPSRTVMWNLLDYRVKGMWDEYGECQNNLFVINEKEIREQINYIIF